MQGGQESLCGLVSRPLLGKPAIRDSLIRRGDNYPDAGGRSPNPWRSRFVHRQTWSRCPQRTIGGEYGVQPNALCTQDCTDSEYLLATEKALNSMQLDIVAACCRERAHSTSGRTGRLTRRSGRHW